MQRLLQYLENQKNGLVFLSAPTMGGKTELIKTLKGKREDVAVMSAEQFLDRIFLWINTGRQEDPAEALADYRYICIEDMDWYAGREATQQEFAKMLIRLGENATVIVTGVRLKARLPHLFACLTDYAYFEKEEADDPWM